MDTLDSNFPSTPSTLGDVLAWQSKLAREGRMDREKVRLRRTAITRMASVLDGDPRNHDAQWILANLDEIERRLIEAPENTVSAGTVRSYKSRCAAAITDYMRYRNHPDRLPSGRGRQSAPRTSGGELKELALELGRTFRYSLPRGFTQRDLRRVYLHLLSQVHDIDQVGQAENAPVQMPLDALPAHKRKEEPIE